MLHRMTPKESDISTPLAPDSTPLIAAFAQRELNGHDDLRDHDIMPAALWQAIGAAGLAQIGLPVEYGGTGGGFRILASAAETLSAEGGIKGVTNLLARPPAHFPPVDPWPRQRSPAPRIPARPRRRSVDTKSRDFRTRCRSSSQAPANHGPNGAGDGFILNGEKAYVTNGPDRGRVSCYGNHRNARIAQALFHSDCPP